MGYHRALMIVTRAPGSRFGPYELIDRLGQGGLTPARERLGADGVASAERDGRTMALRPAIEYALSSERG